MAVLLSVASITLASFDLAETASTLPARPVAGAVAGVAVVLVVLSAIAPRPAAVVAGLFGTGASVLALTAQHGAECDAPAHCSADAHADVALARSWVRSLSLRAR